MAPDAADYAHGLHLLSKILTIEEPDDGPFIIQCPCRSIRFVVQADWERGKGHY